VKYCHHICGVGVQGRGSGFSAPTPNRSGKKLRCR
jgi:hypothetical protein